MPTPCASGWPQPASRVEVDDRTESVGRKIRDAELAKIPFMLVVGDREADQSGSSASASIAAVTPAQ